jgi:hypothetical protein
MKNNKEQEPLAQPTEQVMEQKENKIKKFLGLGKSDYVKVDDKNRFYYMLQGMQNNRWRITLIVLFLIPINNVINIIKPGIKIMKQLFYIVLNDIF